LIGDTTNNIAGFELMKVSRRVLKRDKLYNKNSKNVKKAVN